MNALAAGTTNWWRLATISGLGQGLPRHRGALGRTSLSKLIAAPPEQLAKSIAGVRDIMDRNQTVALANAMPMADRITAIELLAYQPFAEAADALEQLLAAEQPVAVQSAAISALSRNGSIDAAKILLRRWSALGPAVRGAALTTLLRRTDSTKLVLAAMAAKKMSPAVLSIDQRVALLKHRDKQILDKATKLLGGAVSTNRQAVAERYRGALDLKCSAKAGQQVFKRVCTTVTGSTGKGTRPGPT